MWRAVEKLASMMCTQEEIASYLGCSTKTLQRDSEFCRTYKEGLDKGKMSLRRKQMKLADKSAAMAIFLGKNYLNQTDKQEVEHSGEVKHTLTLEEADKLIQEAGIDPSKV